MYPALITAAFITGILLNDVIQTNAPMEIGKHFLFGFLAVLGLLLLEARDMQIVAWGLLIVPTTVFLASLLYVFLAPAPVPAPVPMPIPPSIPETPKEEPTVQLPEENTVCVELEFDPSKPNPPSTPSCDIGLDGTIGLPGTVQTACPTTVGQFQSSPTTAANTDTPSTTKTLDDLLKTMDKSLTPVTVCS